MPYFCQQRRTFSPLCVRDEKEREDGIKTESKSSVRDPMSVFNVLLGGGPLGTKRTAMKK